MRILVTGGAGYIGGTVAQLMLDQGHDVVIYDNLCHGHRSLVPQAAEFVEGELADKAALKRLLDTGIDGVMHFAALIEAGESMKRPESYFRTNTASTLTLLEGHENLRVDVREEDVAPGRARSGPDPVSCSEPADRTSSPVIPAVSTDRRFVPLAPPSFPRP